MSFSLLPPLYLRISIFIPFTLPYSTFFTNIYSPIMSEQYSNGPQIPAHNNTCTLLFFLFFTSAPPSSFLFTMLYFTFLQIFTRQLRQSNTVIALKYQHTLTHVLCLLPFLYFRTSFFIPLYFALLYFLNEHLLANYVRAIQ